MKVQALLNADVPPSPSSSSSSAIAIPSKPSRPSFYSPVRHLSESSHGSSPSRSPTSSSIPSLERSNSSDSGVGPSPSPLTPVATGFDAPYSHHSAPHHHHYRPSSKPQPYLHQRPHIAHARSYSSHYPPMDTPSDSYPATPQSASAEFSFPVSTSSQGNPYFRPTLPHSSSSSSFSMPPQPPQQQQQQQQPPPLAPTAPVATLQQAPQASLPPQQAQMYPDNTVTASKPTKKNSYPCPVSKQYNCNEFFTTSGHAARHAKKHTGKKDAICPECGKAFTRKDNMEQHRRTHSGNRGNSASSAANVASKPVSKAETPEEARARRMRQQQRKARPSSISTASSAVPDLTMLDPALRGSPTAGIFTVAEEHATPYGYVPQQQQQLAPTAMMQAQPQGNILATSPLLSSIPRYPSPPDASTSPSLAPALDALALAASRQGAPDS